MHNFSLAVSKDQKKKKAYYTAPLKNSVTALLEYQDLTALLEYIDLLNRYSGPLSGWGPGKNFPVSLLWAALLI